MATLRTTDWADGPQELMVSGPVSSEQLVIALHTMWGLTPAFESFCDRLAENGHTVVAPNLYRCGDGPPIRGEQPVDPKAEFRRFSDVRAVWDVRHAVCQTHVLLRRDEPFSRVAVVGLCLGGRIAHLTGALGMGVGKVANLYGLLSYSRTEQKPITPLDVTPLVSSSFLGIFGANDDLVPLEDVRRVSAQLPTTGQADRRVVVLPAVSHDFVSTDAPNYDAQAASTALTAILEYLAPT